MSSRPYAAVLMCGRKVIMVDVIAPLTSKEAKAMIEKDNPGFELIALVPGTHSKYSYVYSSQDISEMTKPQGVDPFDMSYAHE